MSQLRFLLPYGLVRIREEAGMIYRLGATRWAAVRTALNPQLNWEVRWSNLDLLPPRSLPTFKRVVDGGANNGAWSTVLLRYSNPQTLLLIEPNPQLQASLQKVASKHPCVRLVTAALGDKEAVLPLNVTEHGHNSSLLKPTGKDRGFTVRQTVDVPIVTLDSLTREWPDICLLKLDLQGYELPAFLGAREALAKTRYVMTEVNFQSQYDGMALFPEIHTFLDAAGFELVNMSNPYRVEGRIIWADALYRRKT